MTSCSSENPTPTLRLTSMKVSSAVGSTPQRDASRVFLYDFIGLDELCFDEEVAYGAGDARLGFIERVSLKDGGGELLELGVIVSAVVV